MRGPDEADDSLGRLAIVLGMGEGAPRYQPPDTAHHHWTSIVGTIAQGVLLLSMLRPPKQQAAGSAAMSPSLVPSIQFLIRLIGPGKLVLLATAAYFRHSIVRATLGAIVFSGSIQNALLAPPSLCYSSCSPC